MASSPRRSLRAIRRVSSAAFDRQVVPTLPQWYPLTIASERACIDHVGVSDFTTVAVLVCEEATLVPNCSHVCSKKLCDERSHCGSRRTNRQTRGPSLFRMPWISRLIRMATSSFYFLDVIRSCLSSAPRRRFPHHPCRPRHVIVSSAPERRYVLLPSSVCPSKLCCPAAYAPVAKQRTPCTLC